MVITSRNGGSGHRHNELQPNPGHGGRKPVTLPGTLSIVATPIGNARDITLRALDVLSSVALIACEDTRVTGRLMMIHGLRTPMTAYHEHNALHARPKIIGTLKSGHSVALVADAGTPLISDPGYRLVEACLAEHIPVTALPGPSSVLCALTLAGLPTDRFLFAGFPPSRPGARQQSFRALAATPASLIFLESARRLRASLTDMHAAFGARPAVVLREMTKVHEEVRRSSLDTLVAHYTESGLPKGEIVVVIGPPDEEEDVLTPQDLDHMLREALAANSLRDAVRIVRQRSGWPRKLIYERAVALGSTRPA